MKIPIPENLNPIDAIRFCGYGLVLDHRASEQSFSRRLGTGIYPRFHAYLNGRLINLHLDQKQASYEGYSAHSGEYDGETVEREGERIKIMLAKLVAERLIEQSAEESAEKKGFWGRLWQ